MSNEEPGFSAANEQKDTTEVVKPEAKEVHAEVVQPGADTVEKVEENPVLRTRVTMSMFNRLEPPTFISEKKSYASYKKDLQMWSRITSVPKASQAEVVVYGLEGHPTGIKEKIIVNIGDDLENAEDGINILINFLDTIYKEDDMSAAWTKYKNFNKIVRADDVTVSNYIADFEKEYLLAKSAGCEYSDIILAFRLLESSRLSEVDEKFVLTGVSYTEAKTNKNLFEQVKISLKKFQGRQMVSVGAEESNSKIKFEPALVASVAQVLIAQGWKKPGKQGRRRSNTDPGEVHNPKKNPKGIDGKTLLCFKCKSEYHFKDRCKQGNKDKAEASQHELSMLMVSNNDKGETLDDELVMVSENEEQLCFLVEEAGVRGVIDSACSKTVAGIKFIFNYIKLLSAEIEDTIEYMQPSNTVFQFGGGERRISSQRIQLPAQIGEMLLKITTEVVDADIPLLIGANSLEKSKAVLDFGTLRAKFYDAEVPLTKVGTGHFCISISPMNNLNSEVEVSEEVVLHALAEENERVMTYKELQKLHHLCGHTASTGKVLSLINRAGRSDENTKHHLKKITESCESCQKNGKLKPRPKFSLPRAGRFNQIVTLDLKEFDKSDNERKYICYVIDMHTRLVAAKFIPNKQPCQVIQTVMEKWIGVGYGVMEAIHSDIGGEMSNKEMLDVASNLGTQLTTTASYSPHQNGVNERNHATVDVMIKKMMESDGSLTPEMALYWSLNAKNSLENVYGFSPYQLVFATNPRLPTVTNCGPPGYEGVTNSEVFSRNMNALLLAREQFIKAESSATLKKALKSRVYARGEDIVAGDKIYYKKAGKENIWRGPSKVISVNGKKLFIDQGAHQATVNRDCAVRVGEEFWRIDDLKEGNRSDEENSINEEESLAEMAKNSDIATDKTVADTPEAAFTVPVVDDASDVDTDNALALNTPDTVPVVDNPTNDEQVQEPQAQPAVNAYSYKDIKRGHKLRFIPAGTDDVLTGEVTLRAGKVGRKYQHVWNICNDANGETDHYDATKFKLLERIEDDVSAQVEEAFVVTVPRHLHNDRRCMEAKDKELANWDEFETYVEVEDVGQECIGTVWQLIEKMIDGVNTIKARLCLRGDQEKAEFRTDSPTVRKSSINLFFMLAAKNKWKIKTSDVKCAFLQGELIDREVYVRPPKERRVKGILWLLRKRAYGLTDASRGFYLELRVTLIDLGCKQSRFDFAVYLWFGSTGELEGMVCTHVDDMLHGSGTTEFHKCVMKPLKEKFRFGSEENSEFRYVGMHVKQSNNSISVNQDHYIMSMELPVMPKGKDEDVMDEGGQCDFRSMIGRLGWLGSHSRPDIVFDHICLSTRIGKATIGDMKMALKIVKKLHASTTELRFTALGEVSNWVVEAFADAGYRSLPDKVSSCGGQVVIVRDIKSNNACVLSWRGRKLKRIVTSSTAAETLALNEVISEVVFLQALLKEVMGEIAASIPSNIYTDSENVRKAVHSTATVDDPRLRTEISILQESLEKEEITQLVCIPGKYMIANCMTKRGASGKDLLEILNNGRMGDPMTWVATRE